VVDKHEIKEIIKYCSLDKKTAMEEFFSDLLHCLKNNLRYDFFAFQPSNCNEQIVGIKRAHKENVKIKEQ